MSNLFDPLEINGMTVPNRFVRSATHDRQADASGRVTNSLIGVYEALASGGIGLIVTGHACVTVDGKKNHTMLGVHHDDLIPGLKKLAGAVQRYGSKIALQINHAGRETTAAIIGETPAAPSPVYNPGTKETPRAFTDEEIEALIAAYGAAAVRAASAGFDAVQIHCAHGYLGSQFISPYTNRRKDRWGGSLENRMRFLIEVYRCIRKAVMAAPLILVGGLRSPDLMQRLIADGDTDMVSLCRPFIREPDLVNRWKQGDRKKADCISCNGCLKYYDEPVRCILLD